MIPATTAAKELGINCKTMQKYYDLLRRAISALNEMDAIEQFGTAVISRSLFYELTPPKEMQPVFCVLHREGKISLLFAGDDPRMGQFPEAAEWVYATNGKALCSLNLDSMHALSTGAAKDPGAGVPFWIYAKKRLVKYHGGFRKNFRLFVREMEFRYNHGNTDVALAKLMGILEKNNLTE